MLDPSDSVSGAAFASVGRLFSEFSSKKLSRLAGDSVTPNESSSLSMRSQFVVTMVEFVWSRRDLLMDRASALPIHGLRSVAYPLVYSAKTVASGMLGELKKLNSNSSANSKSNANANSNSDSVFNLNSALDGSGFLTANGHGITSSSTKNLGKSSTLAGNNNVVEEKDLVNAERMLGVSDIVSFLVPYLSSSLDPALVYEIGIHVLSLAGVPGGKPEWASGPITAFLALWDRQEYSPGREAIVKAVVSNLQLLDLHLQVALFKRLLVMVRNLRVEADRMHALACICSTALCVDFFVKESARRGQKPMQGTDVSSFFEDSKIREDFAAISSDSLFREELLACLVETTFQLSQPLPNTKYRRSPIRVLGSLGAGVGYESMGWMQSALEVLEVCRNCLKWDCEGRTYAMDSYLRLLVKLCLLFDTAGGIKSVKDGATSEQVQLEQRLQSLHRQLLDNIQEVSTLQMRVRLLWVLAEHLDLSGSTPLFADEPREPLNILVSTIHRILFSPEHLAESQVNRLQDVQAILVCAQHLGTRNKRAAGMVARELEDYRNSNVADAVNRQCRLILNVLAAIQKFPERKWAARVGPTGEYPFTHYKLSVQYREPAAAQDRKLETIVRTAIRDLWQPLPSELEIATSGSMGQRRISSGQIMSGCGDPILVEAFHVTDVSEHRTTLHIKVLNISEVAIGHVDVQVGFIGGLQLLDGAPRAVRRLHGLGSQESVMADVTVVATRFERAAFCIQLAYRVGNQTIATNVIPLEDILEETEENTGPVKNRRKPKIGAVLADPVVLRCKPYPMPLTDLLLPYEVSPVEFFRIISGLPAMVEHTGKYEYESSERNAILKSEEIGVKRLLTGLKALESKPWHRVCQHILRSRAGFQLCYLAKTWYGDTVAMVIFGMSDIPPDGGFGEDLTTMLCKFVLKSSANHVLEEILGEPQEWLDDLTDGAVRMVSDEELKTELEEKQRKTAEHITLLKQSLKERVDGIPLPGTVNATEDIDSLDEKQVAPLVPEEQQALQVAVLQGWSALKAQQLAVQTRINAR